MFFSLADFVNQQISSHNVVPVSVHLSACPSFGLLVYPSFSLSGSKGGAKRDYKAQWLHIRPVDILGEFYKIRSLQLHFWILWVNVQCSHYNQWDRQMTGSQYLSFKKQGLYQSC